MTDKQLIARLRKADEYEPLGHDGWEAADLIEGLTAKLAKAVEALELIVVDSTWGLEHQTYMKCRKALAAIKGESQDGQ